MGQSRETSVSSSHNQSRINYCPSLKKRQSSTFSLHFSLTWSLSCSIKSLIYSNTSQNGNQRSNTRKHQETAPSWRHVCARSCVSSVYFCTSVHRSLSASTTCKNLTLLFVSHRVCAFIKILLHWVPCFCEYLFVKGTEERDRLKKRGLKLVFRWRTAEDVLTVCQFLKKTGRKTVLPGVN